MARSPLLALVAAAALVGCQKDTIDVHKQGADYNRHALLKAIDTFNAAGRTPAAYGRFAADITALRPGMDDTVAAEAELQLVVLALTPFEQGRRMAPVERAAQMATTVWSTALASPVTAVDPQLGDRNPGTPANPEEPPDGYVQRLCGGPLTVDCMFVVPESQPQVVEAVATRRFARRTKHAVETCQACSSDPAWGAAVARWEAYEIETHAQAAAVALAASPSRWPTAGPAASAWAPAPLLDIADDGGWLLDGKEVTPSASGDGLAAARSTSTVIDVRIEPGARADVLAALIDAAGAAGFSEVRVEAREPVYPWRLRAYRFATGGRGKKPPWRPVDTVQVLLRAVDSHVSSGALAHL